MNFTIYSLASLLAWVTALTFGIITYSHNTKNIINKVFLFLSLSMTIWVSGCFLESTFTNPSINWYFDIYLYTGAAFAPTLFFHSILTIINKKSIFLKIGYVSSVIFVFINFFFRNLYIPTVTHRLSFRFIATPGILWYVYIFFFISITFYGLYLLYRETFTSKSIEINKLKYLTLAYTTVIIAAGFYLLLVFNIETPPIDNLLVIIYSLIFAYAITKHELMDIRLADISFVKCFENYYKVILFQFAPNI